MYIFMEAKEARGFCYVEFCGSSAQIWADLHRSAEIEIIF
jgi:hypothetical protein